MHMVRVRAGVIYYSDWAIVPPHQRGYQPLGFEQKAGVELCVERWVSNIGSVGYANKSKHRRGE